MKWFIDNKKGLIIGFIFGAFIAPFLAVFGLMISFFEMIRPLLIGPLDFVASFIPDIQIGPHAYTTPIYKWILVLGANGICYAIFGGIVQYIIRLQKAKK